MIEFSSRHAKVRRQERKNERPMTDDIVTRLLRLDCCAVSDALDKLGQPTAVTGLPPRSVPRKIAGKVHTVKLVAQGDYVIADSTGVCFLPAAHAAAIVTEAETIAMREAAMGKALLAGRRITEVMGAN